MIRRKTTAQLIAVALALGAAGSPAWAQEPGDERIEAGQRLFETHCAACHGLDARGGGPAAKAMKPPPPDLTKLREQDGRFPAGRVFDVIDGTKVVPAHGSRTMPVWGVRLRNQGGYSKAQRKIHLVVLYLESIQAP